MIKCNPDNIVNIKPRGFRTRISRIKNLEKRIRILHRRFVLEFNKGVKEDLQTLLNNDAELRKNEDTETHGASQETK